MRSRSSISRYASLPVAFTRLGTKQGRGGENKGGDGKHGGGHTKGTWKRFFWVDATVVGGAVCVCVCFARCCCEKKHGGGEMGCFAGEIREGGVRGPLVVLEQWTTRKLERAGGVRARQTNEELGA